MTRQKIESLRALMKKHNIQAYLVFSTDPHQSEYLPQMWERRKWISGFTGSAGDLAVTADDAGLWTDSRYFLQAEQELQNSGIRLFKIGLPDVPTLQEWLAKKLKAGDSVGIDPKVISYGESQKLEAHLKEWKISLKSIETNLVDQLWEDRPGFPGAPITLHPVKYAGEPIESKLERLREKMRDENTSVHILTTLDSIAWLFNIRSRDIEFNPVAIAYAIITNKKAMMFTPMNKITKEVRSQLDGIVDIFGYDDFEEELQRIGETSPKVWLDPNAVNRRIVDLLRPKCELLFKQSPVILFKAIKNEVELAGLKSAHIRDGVAMTKFLHWLENAVPRGGETELSTAAKAEEFRKEQPLYQMPSFATIAGYNEHGAIVHYEPSEETNVELKPEGIFLFDSGAQYLDGTTDITRTVALGTPTAEQKELFTRVLKGHIQLAMTRFPRTTAGNQLDTIARKPLWDVGLNYGHGTGHGIGSYLNVHEGPHAISFYRGIGVPLEEGMVISNEPGYYKSGDYGIRIENLIVTVEDREFSSPDSEFYKFETVTLCPIDTRLIEKSLLSEIEIGFFNEYHRTVRELLSPHLEGDVLAWLHKATEAI